jgi:hypothetical protein
MGTRFGATEESFMAKTRTLQVVEKDIRRVRRAEKKLRSNWNHIHRNLATFGGLVGLPQKGDDAVAAACKANKPPTVSVYLRHQREVGKALELCAKELKSLEVERVALTAAESEKDDEYTL